MCIRRAIALSFAAFLVAVCTHALPAQSIPGTPLEVPDEPSAKLVLTERLTIGSLDGEHDAFGRIMDVAQDGRGRIFVADDLQHTVLVFDTTGEFIVRLGRQGAGPGEFQAPWRLEVGTSDSLFVWDSQQSRILVFTPQLEFARSFAVSPAWLLNSLKVLPNGSLLASAYAAGDGLTLRVLGRAGGQKVAFGPRASPEGLAGFEASLLGGTADVTGSRIVFSRKSPYEIWQFALDGKALRRCIGDSRWTTQPSEVVSDNRRGQSLAWKKYVHSSRIVALNDSTFINVILDPVRDRRIVDLVSSECVLLRRTELKGPTNLLRYRDGVLLAARTLDYPEVVVYEVRGMR